MYYRKKTAFQLESLELKIKIIQNIHDSRNERIPQSFPKKN